MIDAKIAYSSEGRSGGRGEREVGLINLFHCKVHTIIFENFNEKA